MEPAQPAGDALPAITDDRGRRKETSVMQSYAMYTAQQALGLAHDRIETLHAEAAAARLAARASRTSGRSRTSAVLESLRQALASATRETPVTPQLNDFPYRS
jgi:hypothetical protein